MKSEDKALCFLLGANTPQGYVSRFDQLIDVNAGWRTYIIKGGPGCGKSAMLKKIAQAASEDPGMELIYCSADVDSLDAVVIPSKKVTVVDGTSPHVLEPKYPGAVEVLVDLTSCLDDKLLYQCRESIVQLTDSNSKCQEYCCRFLAAAASLTGDSYRLALDCVDMPKLVSYLNRLCEREFRPKKIKSGKERIRFLSAVTNKGVVKFTDTAKQLANRVYLINDDWGAISRLMLHSVRAKALAEGYDVISCYCPLAPFDKLEHLFVPELRIGFMTSNRFHDYDLEVDPYRIVNCRRFTDAKKFWAVKKRLGYNRKAAAKMIEQAEELLKEAQGIHDELEGYYTAAMDFTKTDKITEELLGKIVS